MKEIWCSIVANIQNVEFQHAAPFGVKCHIYFIEKNHKVLATLPK